MRILLTGGTGLIGRALCQHWQRQGHDLFVWSRDPAQVPRLCSGAQGIAQLQALDGSAPLDAVVNLAGAPIADRPWTAARRDLLWRSRVDLTRTLVDWMGRQAAPPRVLLSGSAVGWYGDRGEQWLAEDSAPGNADFGSRLTEDCCVITGEGHADRQTLMGKMPYHVMKAAKAKGMPTWLIAGKVDDRQALLDAGFTRVAAVTPDDADITEAMKKDNARNNIRNAIRLLLEEASTEKQK